jgi:hypothetical protein
MNFNSLQVLEKYTYIKSNNEEGKKSYNVDKNRSKDILPCKYLFKNDEEPNNNIRKIKKERRSQK